MCIKDSNQQTKFSPGAIVFLVAKGKKHYYYSDIQNGRAFATIDQAQIFPYEERKTAEVIARCEHARIESWLMRDGKLTMQIPLDAVE